MNDLIEEIEASVDSVKVITKEEKEKRKRKSEIPLQFDVDESDGISLRANIVRYINEKNLTYQDLFDFCIEKTDNNEEEGKRKAYAIISALAQKRNIRSDTIDLLCEFLNVDIILESRDNETN